MNFRKVALLSLLAQAALVQLAGAVLNARHSHTTTLLPDGNILITGGVTDAANTVTGDVQMYNMATNNFDTWGGGGPLDTPRSSHTATLMSTGTVLIAGGFNAAGSPLSSLEICNAATKICSGAGLPVMNSARGGHTATLLTKGTNAGKVLLCGGQTAASQTSITGACDLFDPSANTISQTGAMISPRMGHSAVMLKNGKVLVTGGRRRNQANTAWLYEPMNETYEISAGSWTPREALLQGRINHTATVLNSGIVMVAGGFNGQNVYHCFTGTEEECWTSADSIAWGYPRTNQDMGSHGYIDGAEYFDQNGGRTVIGESTYGVAPYRVQNHTATLLPDGNWNMYGGYGGIVRTVFSNTPTLANTTIFHLNKTGNQTAVINSSSSIVDFPLVFQLARAVSGRLVDSDIFLSRTLDGSPAVTVENAKIYMTHSTAPVDGFPVGTLATGNPGDFDSTVRLKNPAGSVTFEKQDVSSDGDEHGYLDVITSTITFAAVGPGKPPTSFSGWITAWLGLPLPTIYRGIKGVATIRSGTVTDYHNPAVFSMELNTGGTANIDVAAPNADNLFVTSVTFPVTGNISNLTSDTTIYSPLDAAGSAITLNLSLTYTADEIRAGAAAPPPQFVYGRSDLVIRDMIFSSALGFTPKTNTWKSLSNTDLSPTISEPAFNLTALITPAADSVMLGGRNCEANPAFDCGRSTKTFTARNHTSVFIEVFKSPGGNDTWPASEKLNTSRAYHTSTMLQSGAILTCGGSDGIKALASCELMDPATRKWTYTGSMNYARSKHTATLLPNGTVLVAGGATPSSAAITTAEIYYPSTQRWVITSPMSEPRNNHTATLLPDGNVLITGGATYSTYTVTTEIYISSTAYWQNAGAMTTPRAQHTATLLKNGNVLVAGGVNGFGAVRETEVFDYTTRTFNPALATNMQVGRYAHTANLLRDGRIVIIGGSNNNISELTTEIYNGATWDYTKDPSGTPVILNFNRANHRSVLLPNGKIMVTGGERPGAAQSRAESYDPDFISWFDQGQTGNRSHHTSILTKDNYILNIGGWDGSKYLDTTDIAYFSYYPDTDGLQAETTRQAIISTVTALFNWGDRATLLSDTSNFHGITEASGGGAGPANSSFHNPRVYLQQIDNPSGFMIDLSTRIYPVFGGPNINWERTLSSITIITPTLAGEMPHGWYHIRVAGSGVFSDGRIVQVTVPRPSGAPSNPVGAVLGTSSITWTWTRDTIPVNGADGYTIYSATDNVFITTVAFANTATYTQTGMPPNTAASIMVTAYNLGGNGQLSKSATYYTLAATPEPLNITAASFETAKMEWARNNNSENTPFEVSMSPVKTPKFSDPLTISTPVPFSVNYMSTSTTVDQLSANQLYDFRVRAMNGAGQVTAFTTPASTITISGVNNFSGQALSSATIGWSWDASVGATYYEVYDVTSGSATAVMIASTTTNSLTQTGLSANRQYYAVVSAVNDTSGFGPIRGPLSPPVGVYTLTVAPLPATPNVFSNVSTGSLTANWITNGNSSWTVYNIAITSATGVSTTTTIDDRISFAGLAPNVRHSVTVTPYNGDGIAGQKLDLGGKYTLAKVPASLSATDISMSGIQLEWDPDGNSAATIYEVRSSTNEFFANPITTHKAFSAAATDASLFVSGLLTGTSYYFDVAACNGEGMLTGCTGVGVTARKRAVAAFTLAGPSGAPAGSVGGTSNPAANTTITGVLPNNRTVSIGIPAGAFATATAVAISSSATNPCGYLAGGTTPVEVAIYTQNGAQPQEPVTLTLKFDQDPTLAKNDIINKAGQVVLARYNPVSGQCLPLETKVNVGERTITATLNHFSVFQLMVRTAASDLTGVLVYPNPFYSNRGQGFVTIDRLPANSKVRVYTLSGDKVWESSAGSTGVVIWKGVNSSGSLVASGIYLAVVDSSAGKKVLKLAVER